MKKIITAAVVFAAFAFLTISCNTVNNFAGAVGKEWKLLEVHVERTPFNKRVIYDRNALRRENVGHIYTFTFDNEQISGTGAPNSFNAPYTLGEKQAISIMPIISTQMAPIIQPEKLQEHVFYGYLQNAYEWKIVSKRLELISKTENGEPVRLIFGL
ncbi:MAG: META domain-containing protein [Treponema sp.]|nr:META domain-containing protein [Treponema sp.]